MGCCIAKGTPEERARDKALRKQMAKYRMEEENKVKLLLLGAGESGKSTIVKQFQILFKDGFSDKERRGYTSTIYRNTVTNLQTVIHYAETKGVFFPEGLGNAIDRASELDPIRGLFDDQLAYDVHEMMGNQIFRQFMIDNRADMQLEDSAFYWFENIDRTSAEGYVPSTEDVLRARVMTTGIIESKFDIDHIPFEVYDVGGQKNERRKWINAFDGITAVIFVVGLSEYDQVMREDAKVNRMHDALKLFDLVANVYLPHLPLFLFLNKKDLFEERLETVPLTVCWPDYRGGNNPKAAIKYIEDKFRGVVKDYHGKARTVHSRVSCATDTENVQFVFNGVKQIILEESFSEGLGF
eukprot:GFYU01001084.1.p1 GENE.GFYU01001084.1~~GFYU01001084.1.p1  ORF type:complete len:367 (-),score=94.69 GFYU01001084.1:71-1132(-)